jgi:hypothetical protein
MQHIAKWMALAVGLALPIAAAAQPGIRADRDYCAALSEKYVRYVGHSEATSRRLGPRGSLDGQVAVAQCQQGNAAAAIPVLERMLTNAKINLPARG